MTDWTKQSAADLGRAIARGDVDPVTLAEAFLDKIAADDPDALIYARTTPTRAMAEATAARDRARSGGRLGPLDGVPASWKDLFDTAGTATEAGTKLMAGRVPTNDAEVLRRATGAGMVCLGKTHMSEIAFSGLGVNPMTATSPNAGFPGHAPGGSSSGAAASVACGVAPIGMGTDTGGSVRVPSAWNDLVGMKTTHGVLPLDGAVPLASGFDTIGPLARTVEDAALGVAAMGGGAADLAGASLSGVRFAVLDTIVQDGLAPEVASGFDRALDVFAKSGAVIDAVSAPELNAAFGLAGPLYTAEAWSFWGPMIDTDPDAMWHHIRDRVSVGADVRAAEYLRAWADLRVLRDQWHGRVAGYDAVLCPSVAILPPPVDRLMDDGDFYKETNLLALRNTRVGNLMGLCGLSVPTGVRGVGVLLNGAPNTDLRLLRIGAACERALA